MKLNDEQLSYLKSMIEPARIQAGEEIGEDYSHDELGGVSGYPDVLIKVVSTEEVSRIMTYAYEQEISVVVRGAGTGLVGAAVAVRGGIMLETTLMNHILELD